MRITAGQFRGRTLQAPPGDAVRPTSDKLRQAIFNILLQYGHPVDSVVLDAFCGTGALGLEALSRGATQAIFMDRDKTSINFARDNGTAFKLAPDQAHFLLKDATKPGPRPAMIPVATLAFFDPPYRKDLITSAAMSLHENGWIDADTLLVMESESAWQPQGFDVRDDRQYGETRLVIGYLGQNAEMQKPQQ